MLKKALFVSVAPLSTSLVSIDQPFADNFSIFWLDIDDIVFVLIATEKG